MTTMTRKLFAPIALAAALTAAGAAHAQARLDLSLPQSAAGPAPRTVVTAAGVPPKEAPDLENPLDPQARPKLQTQNLDGVVFARTSVDHRFDKQGATASAGVLCGRMPGHGDNGGAAAYGIDPHGRFVGAKLSFAF